MARRRLLLLFGFLSFWEPNGAFGPTVSFPSGAAGKTTSLLEMQGQQAIDTLATVSNPWYSDPSIGRDRTDVLDHRDADWKAIVSQDARFVLQTANGMYYNEQEATSTTSSAPQPVFWTYPQLVQLLGEEQVLKDSLHSDNAQQFLAWLGEHNDHNYWICYVEKPSFSHDQALQVWEKNRDNHPKLDSSLQMTGLREFGDRLHSSVDSAILATANGIVEFHTSHPFCAKCGSSTRIRKAGASRQCANCGTSVYPRIDVASIMLITTRCQQYALLGRKQNWPPGRYSTLAGFAEVGETLEQCCARETHEESGVTVERSSIRFVCSQPWPFPRSLMVGFRAQAKDAGRPDIAIDKLEMEDVQWFHKDYVRERLSGGSTAMSFTPNEKEQEFHIPGRASLARILISQWANE